MKKPQPMELFISKFLTIGVIFCGLIILGGWIFHFNFSGNPFFNFETYDRIPLKDLIVFYFEKKDWHELTSYLGFSFLISLPFIRVVLMIFLYLKNKEYILALISLLVLFGLLLGLMFGIKLQ